MSKSPLCSVLASLLCASAGCKFYVTLEEAEAEGQGPVEGGGASTPPGMVAPAPVAAASDTPTIQPMMPPVAVPAQPAPAAMMNATQPQPPAAHNGHDAGGTCRDRVVSRSKPCHDDPDPCGLRSGFPGDEYCLLPPPAGQGIQIHFGPKSYTDAAAVREYTLEPDREFNNSMLAHIPLTEAAWFQRVQVQMRPGVANWFYAGTIAGHGREGVYPSTSCDEALAMGGGFGGGQNLIYDNPPLGIPAPENAGIGASIEGNSSACVGVHAYNFSDEVHLREAWVNLWFIDRSEVTQRTGSVGLVGGLGLDVRPGEQRTLTYEQEILESGRIIQLFGHRHRWTYRFAVWLNDALVYDSNRWEEAVTFNYDTLTTNPPLDPNHREDGAVSGPISFQAGDVLRYSCFIDNGADAVLRFANQFEGGEMCNLWGRTVGGSISGQFH